MTKNVRFALDCHRALRRAEAVVEKRKLALAAATNGLSSEELFSFGSHAHVYDTNRLERLEAEERGDDGADLAVVKS